MEFHLGILLPLSIHRLAPVAQVRALCVPVTLLFGQPQSECTIESQPRGIAKASQPRCPKGALPPSLGAPISPDKLSYLTSVILTIP